MVWYQGAGSAQTTRLTVAASIITNVMVPSSAYMYISIYVHICIYICINESINT